MDRAALDAAQVLGHETGGWCPRGRAAEDGAIPNRYRLRETPSANPAQRTEWNVRDSDATLVVRRGAPRGGTALTLALARRWGRPCLELSLVGSEPPLGRLRAFLWRHRVSTLNVAGPRESQCPGIGEAARRFLLRALASGR